MNVRRKPGLTIIPCNITVYMCVEYTIAILSLALAHGMPVNAVCSYYDREPITLLGHSIYRKDETHRIRRIDLLIQYKANINEGNGYVLACAARWNQTDLVKHLIHHGADVNISGGTYYVPAIKWAREYDNQDMIRVLLDAGAVDGPCPPRYGLFVHGGRVFTRD